MGYGGHFSGKKDYLRNHAFDVMKKATLSLKEVDLYDFRCIELPSKGTFQEIYSLIHQAMERCRPEIVLIGRLIFNKF
jgi:hypothetical protein